MNGPGVYYLFPAFKKYPGFPSRAGVVPHSFQDLHEAGSPTYSDLI